MRKLGLYLDRWIRFYKRDTEWRDGVSEEDIAPREIDRALGRYFIA